MQDEVAIPVRVGDLESRFYVEASPPPGKLLGGGAYRKIEGNIARVGVRWRKGVVIRDPAAPVDGLELIEIVYTKNIGNIPTVDAEDFAGSIESNRRFCQLRVRMESSE